MKVWRICKSRYAESALSGEGARLFAGRWNRQGARIVYTSRSLALAAVELFIHLDPSNAPTDLVSICVEIPESLKIGRVEIGELPVDWRRMDSDRLREIGGSWAASMRNPAHPDFGQMIVARPKPFFYDERMFRR
jgi:RES domain-containing protein